MNKLTVLQNQSKVIIENTLLLIHLRKLGKTT